MSLLIFCKKNFWSQWTFFHVISKRFDSNFEIQIQKWDCKWLKAYSKSFLMHIAFLLFVDGKGLKMTFFKCVSFLICVVLAGVRILELAPTCISANILMPILEVTRLTCHSLLMWSFAVSTLWSQLCDHIFHFFSQIFG